MITQKSRDFDKMKSSYDALKKRNDCRHRHFRESIEKSKNQSTEIDKRVQERLNRFIPDRNKEQ